MAKLLLVDDDPDQVEIRKLVLETAGHEVSTSASAAEAIRVFDQEMPALVLMDLRLPRTEDGLALIRDLRSRSSSVRILVLSGWTADLERLPENALVDRVLRKPVRSQHLLGLIKKLA
jgi:DNA-binding response OmpR family regulator